LSPDLRGSTVEIKEIKLKLSNLKRHGAEEVNSNEGAGATSSKRGAVAYGNS